MRTRGPVLTLLAVLAVGVAVFAVNTVVTGGGQEPSVAPAAQQAPAQAGDGYGAGDYAAGAAAAAPTQAPQQQQRQEQQQSQAPAVEGTFAGRSAGNEVTVAMGVQGDKVIAYVCDGKKVEAWLEGTVTESATGSSLQLTGADGELSADVSKTAVLGTVAVGGKSWPFSAQPEQAAGAATDRAALKKLGSA